MALFASSLIFLLACGGGGGGSSPTPPPPPNPTITSFTASAPQIFRGDITQLNGVFANGTGKIGSSGPGSSQVSAAATSGTSYPVTPQSTTTYTLTVTNTANASTTADTIVNVETNPPAITSFTTPSAVVPFGSQATLSWALGARTTALTLNGSSVQGLSSANVTPVRRSTYTLVASNPLGADASRSLSVAARGIDLFAGQPGSLGNLDGQGSAARFGGAVWYGTRDAAGNLYFADTSNHSIRKVTPGGLVSTFAGLSGASGSADGTGSAARFNNPRGIAADAVGNLYVGDVANATIRKITPAGVVTTLAGTAGSPGYLDGVGPAAKFSSDLQGLAVDGAGAVFVADSSNYVIRKIQPDGTVSTLAGSPGAYGYLDGTGAGARFDTMRGLAVDGSGNLFLADATNCLIRKIVVGSGAVSTLAGSAGVSGTQDGVGSAARFDWTCGICLGPDGMIYAADYTSARIRRVNPGTGEVATVAGTSTGYQDGAAATAKFDGPCAIVAATDGSLYLSDWSFGTLRKIAGGVVTTLAGAHTVQGQTNGDATSATFYSCNGLGIDQSGNLLVADGSNYAVRKVANGQVSTLAGGTWGSADGTGAAARFRNLNTCNLGFDAAGNAYLADSENQTIRKVTPAGEVTTLAGFAGNSGAVDGAGAAARFQNPRGVAVDGAGNVFVADTDNHTIRKITAAGVVTTFAGLAGSPGGTDGTGSAARFSRPTGLAVDAAGNLYVAEYYGNTIRKVTPGGVVTTLAGSAGNPGSTDGSGSAARFSGPLSVALDGSGNLFVADYYNNLLRKVTPAGDVTTVAGSRTQFGMLAGPLPGTLWLPLSVAVTSLGDLLVGTRSGIWLITAP